MKRIITGLIVLLTVATTGCQSYTQYDVWVQKEDGNVEKLKGIPIKDPDGRTIYINGRSPYFGKDSITISVNEKGELVKVESNAGSGLQVAQFGAMMPTLTLLLSVFGATK